MAIDNVIIRDNVMNWVKSVGINSLLGKEGHEPENHPDTARKSHTRNNGVKGLKLLGTDSSPGNERHER